MPVSGVMMRIVTNRLPTLPSDRCPHASGRAGGFERCPAFHPVIEQPVRRLEPGLDFLTSEPCPLMTCAHLGVGGFGDGRYYARCRLGAPEARWRYAARELA